MVLNEILDSNAKIRIVFDTEKHGDRVFQTESDIGGRLITFEAFKGAEKNQWTIEFFEDGRGYDLTGNGREFEVFSMVKQSIEMLIQRHNPDALKFSAEKKNGQSRAALYEKFIKRYMKGWRLEKSDTGSMIVFLVTKKS